VDALDAIRLDANKWYPLQHFEDLPSIIWDIWKDHKRRGGQDIFREVIASDITDGRMYLERIKGIISNGEVVGMDASDLTDFLIELSELQSRIHMVIATLQVRLDMVTSGLVDQFPKILCPTDMNI